MAVYYVFNENIITKNCPYRQEVEFDIEGTTIKVAGGRDNKARLNISPFLLALFGDVKRNDTVEWQTMKQVRINGANHECKYGYQDLDEVDEWTNGISPYSISSTTDEGEVLLRFLDHFGNWRYWVFCKGSESITDATGGTELHDVVNHYDFARPQIKYNASSVTLHAPLVDYMTFQFLCDIKRSIHVCILGENEWLPVNVTTGTTTWVRDSKKTKLQDFSITVNLQQNHISL